MTSQSAGYWDAVGQVTRATISKNKMDDASLQKLSVSPGKLSPKFNKDITEYSVVVGSSVKELKVSPLTSDNNACYSISVSINMTLDFLNI